MCVEEIVDAVDGGYALVVGACLNMGDDLLKEVGFDGGLARGRG